MGSVATQLPWLFNFVTQEPTGQVSSTMRRLLSQVFGAVFLVHESALVFFLAHLTFVVCSDIHERADLPKYVAASETFVRKAKSHPVTTNQSAKAFGKKKVVLFATCIVNYHKPDIGAGWCLLFLFCNSGKSFRFTDAIGLLAAREVLAHNGVEVKVEYPMCCGMPQLEAGKVNDVTARAEKISAKMKKYIDDGYDIVTPTASCSLMIKKEWPLLAPLNKVGPIAPSPSSLRCINLSPSRPLFFLMLQDIQALADKSYDISEYIIKISKENGLAEGLSAIDGTVTLHHACHSRAQANGFKSQEMLQLIPQIQVASIERCSGHGGSFGVQNVRSTISLSECRGVINCDLFPLL
jgi:glycerol-3-phosphate dehydrogenase subunit C